MPARSLPEDSRRSLVRRVAALLAAAAAALCAAACTPLFGHPSLRPLAATCQDISDPDPAVRRAALESFRRQEVRALDRVLKPAEEELLADCLRRIAPLVNDLDPEQRETARVLTRNLVALVGPRESDVVVPALLGDVRSLWSDSGWQQRLRVLGRRTSVELHAEDGGIATEDRLRLMDLWLDLERLREYGGAAAGAEPLLDAILGNVDLAHLAREGH